MSSTLAFTSPYDGAASRLILWFGFLGAPVAWSVQELVSYVVMAHACYPHADPVAGASTPSAWIASTAVSVVMLVVSLAALGISIREAGRLIPRSNYGEASATSHRETAAPYLAFGGVLFSSIFTALIIYNGIALIAERACGS